MKSEILTACHAFFPDAAWGGGAFDGFLSFVWKGRRWTVVEVNDDCSRCSVVVDRVDGRNVWGRLDPFHLLEAFRSLREKFEAGVFC